MADSDMSTEVAHLLQDHILACGDPSHGLKEKLIIMSHFRIKENKAWSEREGMRIKKIHKSCMIYLHLLHFIFIVKGC